MVHTWRDNNDNDSISNVENLTGSYDNVLVDISGSNHEPTFFEDGQEFIQTSQTKYAEKNTATVSGWIKDLDNVSNTNTEFDYIDVWLAYPDGEWQELEDITELTISPQNTNWASFEFDIDLSDKPFGNYSVWLQGYDQSGTSTEIVQTDFRYGNTPPRELSFETRIYSGEVVRLDDPVFDFEEPIEQDILTFQQLELHEAWVYDADGADNLSSVDFWISDGEDWSDVADATSFETWSEDSNWAKINYYIDISEYAPGTYTLWGQAYDKDGQTSNSYTDQFAAKTPGPQNLQFQTDKASYNQGEKVTLTDAWVYHDRSAYALSEVVFWLRLYGSEEDADGITEFDVDDVTEFDVWNNDSNWAEFDYQLDLDGYAPGTYELFGTAYDNLGVDSNVTLAQFTIEDSSTPPRELSFEAEVYNSRYGVIEEDETITEYDLPLLVVNDLWVYDANGADDISSVDLWIHDGKDWSDFADITNFDTWSEDDNWASYGINTAFILPLPLYTDIKHIPNYDNDLTGYSPGTYTLWGQAYDNSGLVSNEATATFTIEDSIVF